MFQLVIFSALVISAIAEPLFQNNQLEGRIVGGHEISIEDAPHQVAIIGTHLCGGSIISKNLVLTAAHCFKDESSKFANIWAGSNTLLKGSRHKIEKIYKHEKFSYIGRMPYNDIAIVKVSNDFKFDETTKPITLISAGTEAKAQSLAVASGWGRIEDGGKLSSILRSVSLRIISKNDCAREYFRGIPKGQICTSVRGMSTCQGDSGGPLTINGTLAGVVSWGTVCGGRYPVVFTEVSYYHDWIQSTMRKINNE